MFIQLEFKTSKPLRKQMVQLPKEALSASYYYSDNKPDNLISVLGNCWENNVYLIMKQKLGNLVNEINLYNLFVEDINIFIEYFSNNTFKINQQLSTINQGIYTVQVSEIKGNAQKALSILEDLLDTGEIILINTVCQQLRFSTYYNSDFDIGGHNPTHGFLILWHDKDNLYYVENSLKLNPNFHKSLKGNGEIGVANKMDFMRAFDQAVICNTFTFNLKNIMNSDSILPAILETIVLNYYSDKIETSEAGEYWYGRKAIEKLLQLCSNNNIYLNKTLGPHFLYPMQEYIWIAISNLCNRRKLLQLCINNHKELNIQDVYVINDIFNQNVEFWIILRNTIEKNCRNNHFTFNSDYKKCIEKIIHSEDRLINEIQNLTDSLTTRAY